jgi:hypothetical protein
VLGCVLPVDDVLYVVEREEGDGVPLFPSCVMRRLVASVGSAVFSSSKWKVFDLSELMICVLILVMRKLES